MRNACYDLYSDKYSSRLIPSNIETSQNIYRIRAKINFGVHGFNVKQAITVNSSIQLRAAIK